MRGRRREKKSFWSWRRQPDRTARYLTPRSERAKCCSRWGRRCSGRLRPRQPCFPTSVLPGSVAVQLRPLHLRTRSGPALTAQWADGSQAQHGLGRDPVLLRRCRPWHRVPGPAVGCRLNSASGRGLFGRGPAVSRVQPRLSHTLLLNEGPDPPLPPQLPHRHRTEPPGAHRRSSAARQKLSGDQRVSTKFTSDVGHDDRRRSNSMRSCPLLASCFILHN